MYLNFYQLQKKPFSLAPDPDFLYLSQQHKDALGAMIYGVREKEGFISVIGEVGTGKTTIVRSYLQRSDRKQILPIFIFNSRISFAELMTTFLRELGIDPKFIRKMKNLNDLVRFAYRVMLEKTKSGKTIVLIIDEAQNMPVETLGKLCILSNFETTKAKLIQIVLVGQPELHKKLNLYELRQLRQRIAYRARISPLSAWESVSYINHRLSRSSKKESIIFKKSAISKIVKYSKGVPRVINVLCENSLVAGYGLQKKPISTQIVKQVIAEYEGRRFSEFAFKTVAGSMFLLLLVMLLISINSLSLYPKDSFSKVGIITKTPQSPHLQKISNNEKVPYKEDKVTEDVSAEDQILPSKVQAEPSLPVAASNNIHSESSPPVGYTDGLGEESFKSKASAEICVDVETALPIEPEMITLKPTRRDIYYSQQSPLLRIAKKGDTVSRLSLSSYGFVNSRVLQWVKNHNPHILDIDEIQIGEIIFFPRINKANLLQEINYKGNRSMTTREEVVAR